MVLQLHAAVYCQYYTLAAYASNHIVNSSSVLLPVLHTACIPHLLRAPPVTGS